MTHPKQDQSDCDEHASVYEPPSIDESAPFEVLAQGCEYGPGDGGSCDLVDDSTIN